MVIDVSKMKNPERAKIVRKERKRRAWSQNQLSEVADLSTRTVQRVEKDGTASPETLKGLASAFNMTPEELSPKSNKNESNKKTKEKVHYLPRLKNGRFLTDIIGGTDYFHPNYDEPEKKTEKDMIAGFFQNLHDVGDIWNDLDISAQIGFSSAISDNIKELEEAGFWVFGIRRKAIALLNHDKKTKMPIDISTIIVKRSNCRHIIKDEKLGNEFLLSIFET